MWRKPVIGIGNGPTAAVQPLPASERVPVFPRPPLQSAAGRREAGASAVEFAIAAPALILALLGTFQAALLYQARAQLEVAAQEAVRAGTLHGARVEAMRTALARWLTPLYTHGRDLGTLGKGHAAATLAAQQADIRIINPTWEAFADFVEQTRDTSGAWVRAIPVDHLGYRQTSAGSGSGLNVQDATLLKIQVTYVQPLIMPFIDQIGRGIYQIQQGLGQLGVPQFFGLVLRPVIGVDGRTRWGISMQAEALMRMQSPVLAGPLPTKASLEQGQNHGGGAGGSERELEPIAPPPNDDLPTMPDSEAPPPNHICNAGTENRPAP
ncbi:TadE/TadG family type IV pilus assembly protein [Acidithiobacillus sulfuriphilus]|uniref:TadE/TadG family type IV pilus assembly protein n=1 Tax=Acidithiobacillus sulfuriphilus TaxID=1867749 RepID=UPI003F6131AB